MISRRQFAANVGPLELAPNGGNKWVRRPKESQWHHVILRDFVNAVREVRSTFRDAFDTYRPELHYMRGPGPKCNAKHSDIVTTGAPVAYSL
jgi:hypothetical protein